jgi:hypothetical protein
MTSRRRYRWGAGPERGILAARLAKTDSIAEMAKACDLRRRARNVLLKLAAMPLLYRARLEALLNNLDCGQSRLECFAFPGSDGQVSMSQQSLANMAVTGQGPNG